MEGCPGRDGCIDGARFSRAGVWDRVRIARSHAQYGEITW
jgi:hypothetical protein